MRHHHKPQHFDGFTVSGFAHEQPDGSVRWHVAVYRGSNHTRPHHDWWLIGGELHATRMAVPPPSHDGKSPAPFQPMTLEAGDVAANVPAAEKAAILKAAAVWETRRATRSWPPSAAAA